MAAYYNEHDPYAAQWLRNLIAAGLIPAGDVDERSIVDVKGEDVSGYTQCHFFAGIGGWPLACRLAGIPDDEPIWTGSCPCQPFSAAGKQRAEQDERHLWPEFLRLIRECNPSIVCGEQVASKLGRTWLDGVRADLEGMGAAFWAADLCAAGVGAPHIRPRLYWLADTYSKRCDRLAQPDIYETSQFASPRWRDIDRCCRSTWSVAKTMEGADNTRRIRPSDIQLLADGLSEGMGRLRAYGNAIVPQVAATFLAAAYDALNELDVDTP